MNVNFFLENFKDNYLKDAIIWKDSAYTYEQLYNKVNDWDLWLEENGVANYDVVVIEGDFSPNSISLFFSLIKLNWLCLNRLCIRKRNVFIEIAKLNMLFQLKPMIM